MAKENSVPDLLLKMVKFVRHPSTNWSELDAKETGRDEPVSKPLLKEMIERKRRNDVVRKSEFDMLRKMRKSQAMAGQDSGAPPLFFHSSMPTKTGDRSNTLKKIDEIEAQMSMQWWKTQQGNVSSLYPVDPESVSNFLSSHSIPDEATKPPRILPEKVMLDNALPRLSASHGDAVPTGLDVLSQTPVDSFGPKANPPKTALAIAAKTVKPLILGGLVGSNYEAATTGFSQSNMMAIDMTEIAHDAGLEEASIRFANGDDGGAEARLLEMLAPDGSHVGLSETWMALFDLYRATDQHEKFENVALKFAQKFDRSAPQWFSMPDLVKAMATPGAAVTGRGPQADWVCPSTVGIQTVAVLKAALVKAPMPWRLDWSNLKTIEPLAVEALAKVFADWSVRPVQLRFIGVGQLQQVLQRQTPSGLRDTPQAWWQLRMEALRITHRPDEFELAALDFCVTYEVSPPSWETARCDYKSSDNQGHTVYGHTIIGEVSRDSIPSSPTQYGDTHMDAFTSQMTSLMSVELSGQIEGDAVTALEMLEAKLMEADIMVISCAKLIRVDFSAAGALLNWVLAHQSEGRAVQFSEVNRLVAAFFNMIGLTQYAKVTTRSD